MGHGSSMDLRHQEVFRGGLIQKTVLSSWMSCHLVCHSRAPIHTLLLQFQFFLSAMSVLLPPTIFPTSLSHIYLLKCHCKLLCDMIYFLPKELYMQILIALSHWLGSRFWVNIGLSLRFISDILLFPRIRVTFRLGSLLGTESTRSPGQCSPPWPH